MKNLILHTVYTWIENRVVRPLSGMWDEQPLALIMGLAILFRLLSAIFSKGWGMSDDHYLVIEPAYSWIFGYNYDYWLPGSKENTGPTGHNLFYPGIHFLLFHLMKWLHLNDPQQKMIVIRLLHGAFSLIPVYFGFRIVEKLEDKRAARLAGILIAICFFMPWCGIRNLTEAVCIPFTMLGFWQIIRSGESPGTFRNTFVAGLFFGLAADIRYQAVLFPAGVVLYFLCRARWKEAMGIFTGSACSFLLVQGFIDLIIWGYPFAETIGYIRVNITDRNLYFNLPWYNYFLTVGGLILPPISLFFFYGFFRGWKRYLLLFLPAVLFFAFHSWFPNKQERFIIPFLPYFIMIGSMGYYRYIISSGFWKRRKTLLKSCWIFFWSVNLILLFGLTFMYMKRSRAESMYYLSKYPYLKTVILEEENGDFPLFPHFYTGKWPCFPEKLPTDTTIYQRVEYLGSLPKFYHPQFFVFSGERNLRERVITARKSFPFLVHEITIEPGFLDRFLYWLNPVIKPERVFIYRNREFYKNKVTDDHS